MIVHRIAKIGGIAVRLSFAKPQSGGHKKFTKENRNVYTQFIFPNYNISIQFPIYSTKREENC